MQTPSESSTIAFQPVEEPATSDRLSPFVVYFSSGFQPQAQAGCTWQVSAGRGSRPDHILIGRTAHVDLVGQTRNSKVDSQPPCRYAVGVLDRKSGVLRYSEIEGKQIVRIEPRALTLDYDPSKSGVVTQPEDKELKAQKSRRLVEAFGSTRRKRQLNTREGAKVETQAVGSLEEVKNLIQSVGEKASAEGTTRSEVLQRAQAHRVLPAHNPEATKPAEAYRLSELIPGAAWASLDTSDLHKAIGDRVFRKTKLAESGKVHPFVISRLDAIQRPGSEAGNESLKGAAYLSALLKLYDGPPSVKIQTSRGGIAAEAEWKGIEVDAFSSMLAQFYGRHEQEAGVTVFMRSDQQRTLMLLHVLIIVLIIERFSIGNEVTDVLRSTLKLTPAQLSTLYRELGCVAKATGSGKARSLQVTLLPPCTPPKALQDYFPEVKAAPKRQRR